VASRIVEKVVGTQLVEFGATIAGEHVVITITSPMGGPVGPGEVIVSVDTTVETLYVETREVPKRVAVGVCWHAMRNYFVNYFVNFKAVQVGVRMGLQSSKQLGVVLVLNEKRRTTVATEGTER